MLSRNQTPDTLILVTLPDQVSINYDDWLAIHISTRHLDVFLSRFHRHVFSFPYVFRNLEKQ